jgi:hypothetical protein
MVEFHRDGEPATLGASTAREEVRRVVEKSKLFSSNKVVEGLVLNLLLELQKEEQI